ncbi:hypothetical protein BH23GEM4_BH23GEM4_17890 [soil metagenome]
MLPVIDEVYPLIVQLGASDLCVEVTLLQVGNL